MTIKSKDYWGTRAARIGRPVRSISLLKQSNFLRPALRLIAGLRVNNEMFLSEMLDKYRAKVVLEVAAGAGQDLVPLNGRHVIGVDLPGSPRDAAMERGYAEYMFYDDEGGYQLSREVDAIVCVNLNAHVSPDLFQKIIAQGMRHLRPDGVVLLVNEYDNDGPSYSWMKQKNLSAWKEMVRRMDHGYLGYESEFLGRLGALGLGEIERQVLIAGVQPATHYLWWMNSYRSGPLRTLSCLAADVPLSIVNAAMSLKAGRNKCYLVGHVLRRTVDAT